MVQSGVTMGTNATSQVTQILNEAAAGDRDAAKHLFVVLYEEFHRLAESYLRREGPGHTLQPTALVHEMYLKMVDQTRVRWHGKTQFFAVGAMAMRRILVDCARHKHRAKRGGGRLRVELQEHMAISPHRDEDLLAMDEALTELAKRDPRQASIVEMRFFGGLTVEQAAEVLKVSKRTVEKEWTMAKAWLRRYLSEGRT